jgi:hypothetical protein
MTFRLNLAIELTLDRVVTGSESRSGAVMMSGYGPGLGTG